MGILATITSWIGMGCVGTKANEVLSGLDKAFAAGAKM